MGDDKSFSLPCALDSFYVSYIQSTESYTTHSFISIIQNLLSGTRAVSRLFFFFQSQNFNTLKPESRKLNVEPSLWLFVNRPTPS